jgi:hypothetical protein
VTDPAPALPQPTDEDRRQHLGFIQAVITRMSAASSTAKGWLLPVVTVTYGYALTQNDGSIALLGIAAVGLFAMLDANYLRQEQAYRRLYDTVARKRRPVPSFTLDPSEADDPPQADAPPGKKIRVWVGRWLPASRVWLSWSIAPFYGGLVFVGLLIALTA